MCFTETWLHGDLPDHCSTIPGFRMVRPGRDVVGIAVFVNERWYNPGHVTVKECLCSPDIDLLAASIRPYHLQRGFSSAILVGVYCIHRHQLSSM